MTLDDAAAELGIFDTDGERCILMQLPSKVPRKGTPSKSGVPAPHASSIDVIPDGKVRSTRGGVRQQQRWGMRCEVNPGSQIGQLRVFETGAIKLELGNVLMDVTPVPRNSFRQDLVSIQNSKDATARGAWWLAEIATRATVTPDLEQLLEEQPIAVWEEAEVPERYAEQRIKEVWKPLPGMAAPHRATPRPSKPPVVVRTVACVRVSRCTHVRLTEARARHGGREDRDA